MSKYKSNIEKELLLYAITDRKWLGEMSIYEQVEMALKGGITMLQLREKHLDKKDMLEEAKIMKRLCHRYDVPLIINDDVELVLEADADGVHVGQNDMNAAAARLRLGEKKILGVSARTPRLAFEAEKNGADYLGAGAVFGTNSKKDAMEIGPDTLEEICSSVKIPVVAIGGISSENINLLEGRGMKGFAVISGIFGQNSIEKAAKNLRKTAENLVYA